MFRISTKVKKYYKKSSPIMGSFLFLWTNLSHKINNYTKYRIYMEKAIFFYERLFFFTQKTNLKSLIKEYEDSIMVV